MIRFTECLQRLPGKGLGALALAYGLFAPVPGAAAQGNPAVASAINRPLYFEANQGQSDQSVRFVARNREGLFRLGATEASITLRSVDSPAGHAQRQPAGRFQNRSVQSSSLQLKFLAANPRASIRGLAGLPGKVNYFIGSDPAKWQKDIPTFTSVQVENLYPGINLVYYGNQQQLEYDFFVAPGADPGRIAFRVVGADHVQIDSQGNIILKLAAGQVLQPRPVIYQLSGSQRIEISGGYRLKNRETVAFQIGPYNHQLPLIIDPVLSYSSFLGSQGTETARAIALDAAGNIYIAGDAVSGQLSTPNSSQPLYEGGYPGAIGDAFVAKFDSTGANLLYLTYLGGTGDEAATSIAVDADGNAYVTGVTDSTNFPVTSLSFRSTIGGAGEFYFGLHKYDAFVVKLDPSGSQLVYSTYVGGDGQDEGLGIAVDTNGCAYVTGFTQSRNFPVTTNAFQTAFNGISDVFVSKFAPDGRSLVYSTLLGGNGDDHGAGIALDPLGRAYVAGYTFSTNFPVSSNAFQGTLSSARFNQDAFVSILETNGAALVQSTYLGGGSNDLALAVKLDVAGNIYVTGSHSGRGFPITQSGINPGGVFRSLDGGATWNSLTAGLLNNQVYGIGFDPRDPLRLALGTGRSLLHSVDGGSTWTNLLLTFGPFGTFAFDPTNPATTYAGSFGVIKTTNAWVTFTNVTTGMGKPGIHKLVVDSRSPGTLYAASETGIFKSTTGAATWAPASAGISARVISDLAINPFNSSIVYAATTNGFFRSTTAAAQWIASNTGLSNFVANAIAFNTNTAPLTIYLGTARGLYKSINAGTNWALLDGVVSNLNILTLAVDTNNPPTLYVGTSSGLLKSAGSDTNWVSLTNGLPSLSIFALATDPTSPATLYASASDPGHPGTLEAFLTKFSPGATSIVYSASLGGAGSDQGFDVAVDGVGNAFVVGSSTSPDFPIFQAAAEPFKSGLNDAFVTVVNADASAFLYSTLLGGKGDDVGMAIAIDSTDTACIVGRTFSPDFPTVAPFRPTLAGTSDGFLAKILFTNPLVNVTFQTVPAGVPLVVDGITNATPVTLNWLAGSFHFISAPPQTVDTNIQYAWSSWSDGGTIAHLVSATTDTTFTASFNLQYFLTVLATNLTINSTNVTLNPADGSVSPISGWFDAGTNVTLVATPPFGELFNGWVGTGTNSFSGTNNPITVTMTGPISETATFTGPLTNRLRVLITGKGSVSPNYNGAFLVQGVRYVMTAVPGAGYVFSNWTGGIFTTFPSVSFIMTNGLVLQANFVPNPFLQAKGTYAGLFFETNGVRSPSSGFLNASITDHGSYSARLQLAGQTFPLSGQFSADGFSFGSILRVGRTSLQFTLQLDLSGSGTLTGEVSDGLWTAELFASRPTYSTTNFAPQAGRYTMVIPGAGESLQQPSGNGFGSVVVDKLGNVTFSGTLGDGTPVLQQTFISGGNQWPLYASLYAGAGVLVGQLAFTNSPATDIDGPITWSKLGQPVRTAYPGGFTIGTEAVASTYGFTNGVRVLNLTNGVVVLENAGLSQSVTNGFTLLANNAVTGTNRLSLAIVPGSGVFQGGVVDPATARVMTIRGALLQKQNLGAGFFLNANQAGSVLLLPSE